MTVAASVHPAIETLYESQGWTPFDFQRASWNAYLDGQSGLIHAPTGMGKTHAAWFGPVSEFLAEANERQDDEPEPLRVLWLTPMRALATDTERALRETVHALELPFTVEKRTGDTSSSVRARQKKRLPTALVTTPESLSLLLSYADARRKFRTLRAIVVDEWHELLSSKRGVQTELCLARLRRWAPDARTWGLSATIGNLEEAAGALVGPGIEPTLIEGESTKRIRVETLIPDDMEAFPWSGHLGLALLPRVLDAVASATGTTLIFTNTRSQTEIWFQSICAARPEWLGEVAVHHGSLDRKIRDEVEAGIRAGRFRCVVCTSSLDLGVDFSPVSQVMQVGSPKGVARLMQRAGRSGHQPGAVSRVLCVPSHALELIEFAAARDGIDAGAVEARTPLNRPLDVLVQHLVTVGIGEGFDRAAMFEEVRSTNAYRELTEQEWGWCLDFVTRGGPALTAYPQYQRLHEEEDGVLKGAAPGIARTHRLGIGTISSDVSVTVRFGPNGKSLGTIEESFITRLRAGDRFVFSGRLLELVRLKDMTAQVRTARKGKRGTVPRWNGGKSPLSSRLSARVRGKLTTWLDGAATDPEMERVDPLLSMQARLSLVPRPEELLVEHVSMRDGDHLFVFPFEGRLVHEGLGALLAHRMSRLSPATIGIVVTDYGIELQAASLPAPDESAWRTLLATEGLLEDLLACLDATQLSRRRFRDIARVAGLILPSYPGERRRARHLQASSDLFYDVLSEFDMGNLLLDQARREVLERELEYERLRGTLERLSGMRLRLKSPDRLTPLAFPLYAESLRAMHVSTESWDQRVRRMASELEKAATKDA